MKDLLVTLALLILGIILAKLILSDAGLMGASKNLFQSQIGYLSQ